MIFVSLTAHYYGTLQLDTAEAGNSTVPGVHTSSGQEGRGEGA